MDGKNIFSSQITFLNFKDFEGGKKFISECLQLEEVYNVGWAVVYRSAEKAFLGAVDHGRAELGAKDGVLISLTTDSAEGLHRHISDYMGGGVSEINEIPDVGLKSFFFTGPEGFNFEIEQFLLPKIRNIF